MLRSKEPYIAGLKPSYRSNKSTRKDEIFIIRKNAGLPVIKSGIKVCLKCEQDFLSPDVKTVRMCNNCKNIRE